MVDFRINWTFYTGEECKAKTNCALIAQFQTVPTELEIASKARSYHKRLLMHYRIKF